MKKLETKKGEIVGLCEFIEFVDSEKPHRFGLFKCKCGKEFKADYQSVKRKETKSCGCYLKNLLSALKKTHGYSVLNSSEYHTWKGMRQRCNNPKSDYYHRYGGRGIKLCDSWQNSFEDFLKDMGSKPTLKHTIERLDNDKGYNKGNCIWATKKEQTRNTCRNRFAEYNGETKCLGEWGEIFGLSRKLTLKKLGIKQKQTI